MRSSGHDAGGSSSVNSPSPVSVTTSTDHSEGQYRGLIIRSPGHQTVLGRLGCREIICSEQNIIDMSANKSIIGLQVSILGLAVANFYAGSTSFGFLVPVALLLYGSYLVGTNEFDR